MISDDANDDTIFTQDNTYKLKGINEVSSTSIIKTIFRHLAIETIRNFANFISSSIVQPFGEAKGVLFDKKNTVTLKIKWLLKEFFRLITSDKVNCCKFLSENCCIYKKFSQGCCMNCLNSDLS